jgi:tRNA-2-methylthio-N6-dimethylallyladenosine synthase
MSFAELLVAVAAVREFAACASPLRIRGIFGRDIVEAIDAVPELCDHVHLPVQSGSTRILRAMLRTYTREEYLEKIAMIRAARRPISVTSDIIVGFPGETEGISRRRFRLLDAAQYDGVFAFQYSPRPNTTAQHMPDAIPEEEKGRRLASCIDRQREIQRARNETIDRDKRLKCLWTEARGVRASGRVAVPATDFKFHFAARRTFWDNMFQCA